MSRRFLVLLAGSLVVLGVVGYAWYRSGSNENTIASDSPAPTTTAATNTSEPTDGVPKRLAWARQFNERQAAGKTPALPAGESSAPTAQQREHIPGASEQQAAAAPTSPARTPLAERVKPPKSEDPKARQIGNQNLTRAEKQALVDKALVEHRLKPKPSPDRVPGASMARSTFVQQQCNAPDIQQRYQAMSAPEKARLRQACTPYGVRFPTN